jgi:hypothetical protein
VPALALLAAEVERSGDVASRRLTWAIIGLLVLAAVIAVATVVFWRITRPDPVADSGVSMRWVEGVPPAQPVPPAQSPPARAPLVRRVPGESSFPQQANPGVPPAASGPAVPGGAPFLARREPRPVSSPPFGTPPGPRRSSR